MSVAEAARTLTVAAIGNPNTGKSTLFSALTGLHARIGNFPGVTVEKKIGWLQQGATRIQLVDLPGTYSLSPRTLDEMVSVDVLLGRQPDVGQIDAVLCIVDASNLERHFYVVSQVLDLGLPVVLVLNMWDLARDRGIQIDVAGLQQRLGVTVLPCEAHRRQNVTAIGAALIEAVKQGPAPQTRLLPPEFYAEAEQLRTQFGEDHQPNYVAERLLLDPGGFIENDWATRHPEQFRPALQAARERLKALGCKVPNVEARVRYGWARQVLTGVVQVPADRKSTFSDRLDRWLTHRVTGMAIFLLIMFTVFQSLYSWAAPLMDAIESVQAAVAEVVGRWLPAGPLQSLLVDGVIAGVGSVVIFLPQIMLLFLFIAILEDCGYMARAAFLMDKLMTKVGLSGKSFVPLMSSFACAIPGIMATRVIENRRDRMTTILVAPLMSCSARLPVYVLMIGAFVPAIWLGGWLPLQGTVLFGMTFLGAAIAVPIAWLLKKTVFRGETPPFVMELPAYKWPSPRIVFFRVYESAKSFLIRAGTLIFAANIIIWALSYFPGDHTRERQLQAAVETQQAELEQEVEQRTQLEAALESTELAESERASLEQELADVQQKLAPLDVALTLRNQESEQLLAQSYLGRAGHWIEPAVRPLGWDWRIGVGVIASFPAREVIVATLGTIYSLGGEVDEASGSLKQALRASTWPDGQPVFTLTVAVSIMVFFALCAQCGATLMVIYRETNHWRWPVVTFVYMTTLAYVGAWLVTQIGSRITG